MSSRFGAVGDAVLRRTRSRLARRVDRIAPAGPVLDVGAGDGTLVDALRRRGREALGLERVESGPGVTAGEVGELSGQWAAVVFWHSLEHLPDPGTALADAAALLAPRGVLILALPNVNSRQAQRFGDDWFALDLPRHLVHLPAGGVLARLGELGLRVERVSYIRGGQVTFGWLHGFIARLPGHPDLYAAIRSPAARAEPMAARRRGIALAAGALLAPFAVLAAAAEILSRRGGTVYVEARR
jgi:SAM-dependent methyltransferase